MPSSWTRPDDVRAALSRKWASGVLLTRFAAEQRWEPLAFPLRGPTPSVIGDRLGEVQQWAREWEQASRGPLRVEYKKVGGKHVGSNTIPCRAWIDSYDLAWALLGVGAEVSRFAHLVEQTLVSCSRVHRWLARHPMKALGLYDQWDRLLAAVLWIDQRQLPGMYLRQIDVPGVDTKFVERHRGVLAELLDLQLDQQRIDPGAPDFEGRYRFRRKPAYVRFRCADGNPFSELTVRATEFTVRPPGVRRAYVVENEITYLAFPCPADAIVIWGRGYAVPVLEPLTWLAGIDVVYWGDIDTHGFAILDRLRQRFPRVRSMLMDRTTLLAHRGQWVVETSPLTVGLDFLDVEETALYRDLIADAFGSSVRLEQERVSFAAVEQAMATLVQAGGSGGLPVHQREQAGGLPAPAHHDPPG
jgi:hypothetical protein